jgi:hypothetical protein
MMFVDVDASPLRAPRLVMAAVAVSALVIIAVGIFPDLFAKFPPLSTLVR